MASFQDKFDRSNRSLGGDNGWVLVTTDGSLVAVGKVTIVDNYATVPTADAYYRSMQSTTVPTTNDQKVEAWVDCTTENASSQIAIGCYGWPEDPASPSGHGTYGVSARLTWNTDGVRTLEILQNWDTTDTTPAVAATLTMVAAGGVEQTGYYGRLIDKGAVDTPQHLRLIVAEDTGGVVAAAYVNQPDDDSPTLTARLQSDVAVPTGTTAGYWFFQFHNNSQNSSLKVLSFEAEDYTLADRREVVLHADWPTLEEVREQVKRRHSGSVNVNISDEVLNDLVNDAWDECLMTLGDVAYFLIRSETLSISFDNSGFATLPSYVAMPIRLERDSERVDYDWKFDHFDTSGNVVIRRLGTLDQVSADHRLKYRIRPHRAHLDDDQLAWPREHLETLVAGVVLRLAERDRSPTWEAAMRARYERRMALTLRDMNRYGAMQKEHFSPRRNRSTRAGRWYRYRAR